MKRWAAHVVLTLSSVLLLLTAVDWDHSLYYSETWIYVRGRRAYALDNYNGEIAFWRGDFQLTAPRRDGFYHEHWPQKSALMTMQFGIENPTGGEFAFAGFVLTTQRRFPTTSTQSFPPHEISGRVGVVVPSWFLTLLFGWLPASALYRFARGRRRHTEGCCAVCGYDLRASSDRCPECGTSITPQTGTTTSQAAREYQTPS